MRDKSEIRIAMDFYVKLMSDLWQSIGNKNLSSHTVVLYFLYSSPREEWNFIKVTLNTYLPRYLLDSLIE